MNTEKLIIKIKAAGFGNKSFAEKLGMAESTFYRKLKKKDFSVQEAQEIRRLLNLTVTEAYEIFFGKNLA